MYDEETARKMLKAVPVRSAGGGEDGETGFDPNDAALDSIYHHSYNDEITPMLYFAHTTDLKMMRYLISRGASTTKRTGDHTGPMHMAAQEGCLDICKLLHANGAQSHVRLANTYGWTPFLAAANQGHDDLVRWLVLHGALCADDDSEDIVGGMIHHRVFRNLDRTIYRTCQRLVDWSKDVLQAYSSVITFLLGTLPDNDRGYILQCLSGHPGIRKNIADFVGLEVTKAKQLCILRSVVEVLPETMRIGRKDES